MKLSKKILAASMAGIMGVAAVGGTATAIVSSITAFAADAKAAVTGVETATTRTGQNNGQITGTVAGKNLATNVYYYGELDAQKANIGMKITTANVGTKANTLYFGGFVNGTTWKAFTESATENQPYEADANFATVAIKDLASIQGIAVYDSAADPTAKADNGVDLAIVPKEVTAQVADTPIVIKAGDTIADAQAKTVAVSIAAGTEVAAPESADLTLVVVGESTNTALGSTLTDVGVAAAYDADSKSFKITATSAKVLDEVTLGVAVAGSKKITVDGAEVAGITDASTASSATVLGSFSLQVAKGFVTVNDGSGTERQVPIDSSNKITLTNPTKEGKIFKGWTKDATAATPEIVNLSTAEFQDSDSLTAYFVDSEYVGYSVANPDTDIIATSGNVTVNLTKAGAEASKTVYIKMKDASTFTENVRFTVEYYEDEAMTSKKITEPADLLALKSIITIGDIRFETEVPANTVKAVYSSKITKSETASTSGEGQEKTYNALAAGNYYAVATVSKYTAPAPDAQLGAGPSVINANGEAGSIERILSAYKIDLGSIKNLFSASDFSRAKINATLDKIETDNNITQPEAVKIFFNVIFNTQWGQENIELTFLQKVILALYL